MRLITASTAMLFTCSLGGFAQQASQPAPGAGSPNRYVPVAKRLEPSNTKPGAILTISGAGLSSKDVEEVFLTDHLFDLKVKVLEQTETTLKVRVPPFAKPGRQQLLLLTTKRPEQVYLEQPVYVLIEIPDEAPVAPVAVSASAKGPKTTATHEVEVATAPRNPEK